jgi:hypothetical protein
MGTTNEKINPRSEEEKRQLYDDSGWNRIAGSESRVTGDKQERVDREDCSRSNFFGDGNPGFGKTLRQLIEDLIGQVAHKHEEKKRIEEEIAQLDSRIQEFSDLLNQLENNPQKI